MSAEKLTLPEFQGLPLRKGWGRGAVPLLSLKQLQEALRSGPQPSTAESQGRGKLPTPSQEKYSLNFAYFPRTSEDSQQLQANEGIPRGRTICESAFS